MEDEIRNKIEVAAKEYAKEVGCDDGTTEEDYLNGANFVYSLVQEIFKNHEALENSNRVLRKIVNDYSKANGKGEVCLDSQQQNVNTELLNDLRPAVQNIIYRSLQDILTDSNVGRSDVAANEVLDYLQSRISQVNEKDSDAVEFYLVVKELGLTETDDGKLYSHGLALWFDDYEDLYSYFRLSKIK